jgi:hypothetical protein
MNAEAKTVAQKNRVPASLGVFAAVLLGATALGVGTIVFFFNPSTHRFYPVCMFHELTGLNCPGCGMTRASYALLHGNLMIALKDNALFVISLLGLAAWGTRIVWQKARNRPATFQIPAKVLWLLLILSIVFAAVRNLPGFEWLSP